MRKITLELQNQLADRFDTYVKLFGSEEIMFDKFIDYHIKRLKREITRMQETLEEYEKKHKMKSGEFYTLFDKGELGDKKEYMLWAGVFELQMDSKQKLSQLL